MSFQRIDCKKECPHREHVDGLKKATFPITAALFCRDCKDSQLKKKEVEITLLNARIDDFEKNWKSPVYMRGLQAMRKLHLTEKEEIRQRMWGEQDRLKKCIDDWVNRAERDDVEIATLKNKLIEIATDNARCPSEYGYKDSFYKKRGCELCTTYDDKSHPDDKEKFCSKCWDESKKE